MASVATAHRINDDGIAFHFGKANRKGGELAVNVVWRRQIDGRKHAQNQIGCAGKTDGNHRSKTPGAAQGQRAAKAVFNLTK